MAPIVRRGPAQSGGIRAPKEAAASQRRICRADRRIEHGYELSSKVMNDNRRHRKCQKAKERRPLAAARAHQLAWRGGGS